MEFIIKTINSLNTITIYRSNDSFILYLKDSSLELSKGDSVLVDFRTNKLVSLKGNTSFKLTGLNIGEYLLVVFNPNEDQEWDDVDYIKTVNY